MIWVSMYIQSYTSTLRFFLQYSYTLSRKQTLSFHSMPQSRWFDFTFIYHKTQSLNRPFYLFISASQNEEGNNQADIDAWKMKDITVRNYILATTEPILKQTLYGIPTAREMWLKMANQYAARAGDLEHVYYQHMYDIKYDAGTHFKIVLFFHWKTLSHNSLIPY